MTLSHLASSCLVLSLLSACSGDDCIVTVENELSQDLTAVLFSPGSDTHWDWDNNLGETAPVAVGERRDFMIPGVGVTSWDFLGIDADEEAYRAMGLYCLSGVTVLEVVPAMSVSLLDSTLDSGG